MKCKEPSQSEGSFFIHIISFKTTELELQLEQLESRLGLQQEQLESRLGQLVFQLGLLQQEEQSFLALVLELVLVRHSQPERKSEPETELKSQKSSSFIPKILVVENINTPAKHSADADFAEDHSIIPPGKNTSATDRQYFFLATGTV